MICMIAVSINQIGIERAQIGVNLGKPGYLAEVQRQTDDLDIQLVFCNAGYMLTGFFDSMCAL